jgi:hypothetical protein
VVLLAISQKVWEVNHGQTLPQDPSTSSGMPEVLGNKHGMEKRQPLELIQSRSGNSMLPQSKKLKSHSSEKYSNEFYP